MEKESMNNNGLFPVTINCKTPGAVLDWTSSSHFYKKGNIIVQYLGKNEKILADLKEILGEQFAGNTKCSNLSSEKDVKRMAFLQLTSEEQDIIGETWQDSALSKITLKEGMGDIKYKSYIGKEVYLIDFLTKSKSVPNDMSVYIGVDNYKLIGYGYVD